MIYRQFLKATAVAAHWVKAIASYLNERRLFTRDGGR
jgi:hypothetical protein